MMLMKRLITPGRNVVHIHIQYLADTSPRKNLKIPHAGFFFRLSYRGHEHVRLSVRVTTKLQPTPEFSMVCEQRGTRLSRNDPGRGCDVTRKAITMKAAVEVVQQRPNPIDRGTP